MGRQERELIHHDSLNSFLKKDFLILFFFLVPERHLDFFPFRFLNRPSIMSPTKQQTHFIALHTPTPPNHRGGGDVKTNISSNQSGAISKGTILRQTQRYLKRVFQSGVLVGHRGCNWMHVVAANDREHSGGSVTRNTETVFLFRVSRWSSGKRDAGTSNHGGRRAWPWGSPHGPLLLLQQFAGVRRWRLVAVGGRPLRGAGAGPRRGGGRLLQLFFGITHS